MFRTHSAFNAVAHSFYGGNTWKYLGELVFNMLVLVGANKMEDRTVHEMMGF